MPSSTRRVVVEIDEEEIEWAAESAKESVPQFVAMALVSAMTIDACPGEERVISMRVDGESFFVVHREGWTEEASVTTWSELPQ